MQTRWSSYRANADHLLTQVTHRTQNQKFFFLRSEGIHHNITFFQKSIKKHAQTIIQITIWLTNYLTNKMITHFLNKTTVTSILVQGLAVYLQDAMSNKTVPLSVTYITE